MEKMKYSRYLFLLVFILSCSRGLEACSFSVGEKRSDPIGELNREEEVNQNEFEQKAIWEKLLVKQYDRDYPNSCYFGNYKQFPMIDKSDYLVIYKDPTDKHIIINIHKYLTYSIIFLMSIVLFYKIYTNWKYN